MRAGDIAIALPSPVVMPVGVSPVAVLSPNFGVGLSLAAVNALETLAGTPSVSLLVSNPFVTEIAKDAVESLNPVAAPSLETLAGVPSESALVGVGIGTSVVP